MTQTGMANYAIIDENNIVIDTFRGRNEDYLDINWEEYYSNEIGKTVKRYSFNTSGGVHLQGGDPFRINAATIGGTYDTARDAFIEPKPISNPSFILDQTKLQWVPPLEKPDIINNYVWSELQEEWLNVIDAESFLSQNGFIDFKSKS